MWFKNLQIYQLIEDVKQDSTQLNEALSAQAFAPCRRLDTHRIGWVPPLGKHSDQLLHVTNGKHMLCMRREERLLPATVIREAVQDKVDEIEATQGRKVGRKEKNEIKDEVVVDLLPRAFTRSTLTYAYIDTKNAWVIVDSASANRAEDLLGLVRESLGSFKIRPLEVNNAPANIMTSWVQKNPPADMELGNECDLQEPVEKGGIIRMRGLDLGSQEVLQHLTAGKLVSKLAIEWQQRLACILSEDLSIKRLRFLDLVMDEAADIDTEDEVSRFDADFALMGMELERFIPALCGHLGGLEQTGLAA